jgi:hypothetical protein
MMNHAAIQRGPATFLLRSLPPVVVALVILVFLDVVDAGTQLPGALSRAVEQALGPGTTVMVRAISDEPPERELVATGRAEGASAVARLSWTDSQRLHGSLEVHVLASDRRATETLTFEASDPLVERGRALGLVLAALLAPENSRVRDERIPTPPETRARSDTGPPSPVAVSNDLPAVPRPGGWFLDASAEGGVAIGGAGSGLGGSIGLGHSSAGRLGWRMGARARFGEIGEAQASILSAGLAAGVVVTLLRAADRPHFELALRLDALLLYEALSHFSSDDVEHVRRGRVVPGAALWAEAAFLLAPGAAVVVGAGPEAVFGRTDVVVHETKVAELVPLRVSMHGGLRITF